MVVNPPLCGNNLVTSNANSMSIMETNASSANEESCKIQQQTELSHQPPKLDKPLANRGGQHLFHTRPLQMLAFCTVICTGILVTGCNSPSEKIHNAKDNVTEAKNELNEAQEDYAADMLRFKEEMGIKIQENEKTISEINLKIEQNKATRRADYLTQIALLEQSNKELKLRMTEYKADSKDNWQKFSSEFVRDLDKLGLALKNFVVDEN